ncbi:hypothetical protein [Melaminivora jejuensis]|uniref:hypothetical protein n=1 Tax=Melaminivora jejuensis TaxID=1267217 RepID=UPI001ADF1E9F|nr:hypothetical protein [Melaminivora jejuensis]UHJ63980.1 hypothetical protein LVC68_11375 [Melaminivora jejuensis]
MQIICRGKNLEKKTLRQGLSAKPRFAKFLLNEINGLGELRLEFQGFCRPSPIQEDLSEQAKSASKQIILVSALHASQRTEQSLPPGLFQWL